MPKILITGNGFDLFHHLPTKYVHFMAIMKTIEEITIDNDVSYEDLFGSYFKVEFVRNYDSILKNYNTGEIVFKNSKIKEIQFLLKNNNWYKYFTTILEVDTWIDFENEIENLLNQFIIFKNYEDKTLIRKNYFLDASMNETDFEIFGILKFYSMALFKLDEKYINDRKGVIDVKKILEDLANSFENFIIIFNQYLVDVVSVFYKSIKFKNLMPLDLMNEIYTFNYTPTFEKIYGINSSKIIYLHGKTNEDNKLQDIVLGVSEITKDIKGTKIYNFTKYYQKIYKSCNKKFVQILEQDQAYDEETLFYIIGHSLDKSDSEYILELFRFLGADKLKKSRICVFYYDDRDRENKIRNLLSVVEEKVVSNFNRDERLYFVELNIKNLNIEFNKTPYKHQIWI